MCSPLAIGSRQASWTIWARCRGGNLLGTSQAGVVQQELLQATLLIAAADSPDGGPVTLQPGGHRLDRLAASDSQDDAGMLDLEPAEATLAGHGLQDRQISRGNGQGARFASTHGIPSIARALSFSSIPGPRISCTTSVQGH